MIHRDRTGQGQTRIRRLSFKIIFLLTPAGSRSASPRPDNEERGSSANPL